MTPGFILRAFLIQSARCFVSFGNRAAGDRRARRDVREVRADDAHHHRVAVDRVAADAAATGSIMSFAPFAGVALAEQAVVEREAGRERRLRNRADGGSGRSRNATKPACVHRRRGLRGVGGRRPRRPALRPAGAVRRSGCLAPTAGVAPARRRRSTAPASPTRPADAPPSSRSRPASP